MAKRIIGYHAIEEALKKAPQKSVLFLCEKNKRHHASLEALARLSPAVTIHWIPESEMDRMAPHDEHRGAILQLADSPNSHSSVKEYLSCLLPEQRALVLALDGITDPQNLGAILRSADQFSVDLVLVPKRRSAQVNQTVARVSSGSAQYVNLVSVPNLAHAIELFQKQGFWIYGADMSGQAINHTAFAPRSVLVMGSEGSGISRLVKNQCDHLVAIPTSGHIDSLNVSVASGIILYEIRRQQEIFKG